MTETRPNGGRDGSRFVMPSFLILMIAISAVYYRQAARDDVDRYPRCFIADCTGR